MTVHACRDLVIGGAKCWASGATDSMWALSAFLQGVLGYVTLSSAGAPQPPGYADFSVAYYSASISPFSLTQVSSSVVSIRNPSCFVSASGGHTLLKFSTDALDLQKAAYPVGWPSGSGPWPQGDPLLGDWIALRSAAYPLANSGIFAVVDSTNWLSGNAVEIDYRTSSATLLETSSYLSASVWLPPPSSDISTAAGRGQSRTAGAWAAFAAMAGNGNTSGYQGQGSATVPRLLLQSPGALGWQLRLCVESTTDIKFGNAIGGGGPALTAFPGFSGSAGDFPTGTLGMPGSQHLHAMQWLNVPFASAPDYVGCLPALDAANAATTGSTQPGPGTKVAYRFYAWGDDATGTCLVAVRGSTASGSCDAYLAFGQPEAEVLYPGQSAASRLFVVGQARTNVGLTWANGTYSADGITGLSFCTDPRFGPLTCTVSSYSFVSDQNNDSGSIRFDAAAGDTPFLGASELIDSELVAGAWDNLKTAGNTIVFQMEPRPMGRFPIARFGRATGLSRWAAADTSQLWLHTTNGFYLPWGGLASLP